jgi:hypothetical protein
MGRRHCRVLRDRVARHTDPRAPCTPRYQAESSRRNPTSNEHPWRMVEPRSRIHRASSWSPAPRAIDGRPAHGARRQPPRALSALRTPQPITTASKIHNHDQSGHPAASICHRTRMRRPVWSDNLIRPGHRDSAMDDSPARISAHSGFNSPTAAYCSTTARRKLRSPIATKTQEHSVIDEKYSC